MSYKFRKHLHIICMITMVITLSTEMTGSVFASSDSETKSVSELEDQKKETLKEIEDLKSNISDVEEEIDSLQNKQEDLLTYIAELDKKSETLNTNIQDFETKISDKEDEIESTQEELDAAKEDANKQYEAMKKRIQFMYENGDESMIEALLASEDFSSFLNEAEYFSSLTEYDDEMKTKLLETVQAISDFTDQLNDEKDELELMKTTLEEEKAKVDDLVTKKKKELSSNISSIDFANLTQEEYEKELKKQEKLLDNLEAEIAKAANGNAYLGEVSGSMIWPCPSYTRISSYFGNREQPIPGASTYHKGIDMAASYGSSILASASGVVTTATYSGSAGNYIVISHGNGVSTVYMHCSSLYVSEGETVQQGEQIAAVGSTGFSTGNHLHFGVIVGGSYVNPLGYVSP